MIAKRDTSEPRWLLLVHQLPHRPQYFRVKIWRRLQRLGAITVKNTVYALPLSEQAREDLEWVVREIEEGKGEAFIIEARFVHGLRDPDVEAMFNRARDEDYLVLREETEEALARIPKRGGRIKDEMRKELEDEVARIQHRLSELAPIDFFSASGREAVHGLVTELQAKLTAGTPKAKDEKAPVLERMKGRTWVTRNGIFVDRIASAWLIQRFIDPKARFKYVNGKGYKPEKGELRFDMFEAEYTHEGDHCTFEVLIERFRLDDRALTPIAEIVHDIDIKDGKFGREQASGVESLLASIASTSEDDEERLVRGSRVLEDLYAFYRKKRG